MPTTYPLGHLADPTKLHRTRENRRVVGYCLSLIWTSPDALASSTTDRHGDSRVGLPVNGRMVTRIELGEAARHLERERGDLFVPIHMVYAKNYTYSDAAARLGISESTLRTRVKDGLDRLIDQLWI